MAGLCRPIKHKDVRPYLGRPPRYTFMATFVHIADSRSARRFAKSGIRASKIYFPNQHDYIIGVYAFPVMPNFVVAHQWLRELKRRGFRTAVGVYFSPSGRRPYLCWPSWSQSPLNAVSRGNWCPPKGPQSSWLRSRNSSQDRGEGNPQGKAPTTDLGLA
jgi:hypothetical protein